MTKREQLNKLYEKYGLTPEDIFKNPSQGWTIITRSGIDKIQAAAGIEVAYELLTKDLTNIIIKATAKMYQETEDEFRQAQVDAKDTWMDRKAVTVETFGEASPKNTRNGYPVAIAEKRAMSRAVLKLSGFYALGVFGEDEADDFSSDLRSACKQ